MDDDVVTVRLSKAILYELVSILDSTQDEGPIDEGWASDELLKLRALFHAALDLAKEKR